MFFHTYPNIYPNIYPNTYPNIYISKYISRHISCFFICIIFFHKIENRSTNCGILDIISPESQKKLSDIKL
jgi:uncharacterized membrane protein YwaF